MSPPREFFDHELGRMEALRVHAWRIILEFIYFELLSVLQKISLEMKAQSVYDVTMVSATSTTFLPTSGNSIVPPLSLGTSPISSGFCGGHQRLHPVTM